MYQSSEPRGDSPVSIIGAGIAGAWQALLFAQAGHAVTLYERSDAAMTHSTSHWAGGMLAPWCEAETSEPVIAPARHPLARSVARAFSANTRSTARWWWRMRATAPISNALPNSPPATPGSTRGAWAISNRRWKAVFATGCFMPTKAMSSRGGCCRNCTRASPPPAARIKFNSDADADDLDGIVIDCRGLSARDDQPELRGVKGEMIIVETSEVELSRPVRLIHPRWPLYVIPRGDGQIHARRDLDRGRGYRRQRALGAGTAGRRLCRASGVCRGAHRRIRLRACGRPFPTICRGSRSTRTGSRSTDSIATAFCWRRRWRN